MDMLHTLPRHISSVLALLVLLSLTAFAQRTRVLRVDTIESYLDPNISISTYKRIIVDSAGIVHDTVAYLSDVVGGGGGSGDTTLARFIRTDNGSILFQWYQPAYTDTVIAIGMVHNPGSPLPQIPPNGYEYFGESSVYAPDYPIPTVPYIYSDTFAIHAHINAQRVLKGFTYSWIAIELQIYVKLPISGDSTWATVSSYYVDNSTSVPPWYVRLTDTTVSSTYPVVRDFTLNERPWTEWVNGYAGYHGTWWDFGIPPGGQLKYRFKGGYGASSYQDAGGHMPLSNYDSPNFPNKDYNFIMWSIPQDFPARWITSARMDSNNWHFYGDVAVDGTVTANAVVAKSSLTIGSVADSAQGVLTLVSDSNVVARLSAANHEHLANYVLPHLATVDTDTLLSRLDRLQVWPSSGPFKYLKADTGITLSFSGDTLSIRASAGGSLNASYMTNPGQRPPTNPSSYNDEFNGANNAVPDTGSGSQKWKCYPGNSATGTMIKQTAGMLQFNDTGRTANRWRIMWQHLAPADTGGWTIVIRCNMQTLVANSRYATIVVGDTATGKIIEWGWLWWNSGYALVAQYWTLPATYSSQIYISGAVNMQQMMYFKLEKTAADKKIAGYYSVDGYLWYSVWTPVSATAWCAKITSIGIGVLNSINNTLLESYFDFFRVNWTPDFDATLHK
jgi:hypothetical protein